MNIENENDHLIMIGRYLSGEATPEQAIALQEWLNVPENKVEYDRIVRIWNQLPGSVDLSDVNMMQEWRELEKAVEANRKKKKSKSIYSYMAAASIILIFITIGFFWFNGGKKTEKTFHANPTLQIIITAKNDIVNRMLPDSSVIIVNRNGNISYRSDFNRSERELKLTGEAFFNITHNESKPFIVSVGNLKIQVVGTSFNVKDHQNKREVEVQVQTGIVKLYTSDKELLVNKGQTGIYQIESNTLVLKNEININSISYATKTFYFNDISFDDAVVYLENAFSIDMQYDKSVFKDCRITAEFANKPVNYILDVISATLNATYTHVGNTFNLTGKGCQ